MTLGGGAGPGSGAFPAFGVQNQRGLKTAERIRPPFA